MNQSPAFSPTEELAVPRLGLRQPALCSRALLLYVIDGPSNLLIGALNQLRQRQVDVCGDTIDLGEAIAARLVEKRSQRMLLEPRGRFRNLGDRRQGSH